MKKSFDRISGSGSVLSFIADQFYDEELLIHDRYWTWQIPQGAIREIEENFEDIASKNINNLDYNGSGLDEFEYHLTSFLLNLEKDFPSLSKKVCFDICFCGKPTTCKNVRGEKRCAPHKYYIRCERCQDVCIDIESDENYRYISNQHVCLKCGNEMKTLTSS